MPVLCRGTVCLHVKSLYFTVSANSRKLDVHALDIQGHDMRSTCQANGAQRYSVCLVNNYVTHKCRSGIESAYRA